MTQCVGFFLGSGCSFPSGQPSVGFLTEQVLSYPLHLMEALDPTSGFVMGLENSYPRWGTQQQLQAYAPGQALDFSGFRRPAESIQKFLDELATHRYWLRPPTYEDLSGLLNSIAAAAYQQLNDPAISCLVEELDLVSKVQAIEFPPHHRYHKWSFHRQIAVIEDFIGWVIAHQIRVEPKLVGYGALKACVAELRDSVTEVHFATTNYDYNIERLLTSMKVEFDDGFLGEECTDDEDRPWRIGSRFKFFKDARPSLIKLHGSLNWFACHDIHGSGAAVFAAAPRTLSPDEAFSQYISDGSHQFTSLHAPEMLRGSLSKILSYSYSGYSDLLSGFEALLDRVDVMVVAGFGWSDEGIAQRLIRFATAQERVLLVLDGSQPEPAISRAAGFSSEMLGPCGSVRGVRLFRHHMSSIDADRLVSLICGELSTPRTTQEKGPLS